MTKKFDDRFFWPKHSLDAYTVHGLSFENTPVWRIIIQEELNLSILSRSALSQLFHAKTLSDPFLLNINQMHQ